MAVNSVEGIMSMYFQKVEGAYVSTNPYLAEFLDHVCLFNEIKMLGEVQDTIKTLSNLSHQIKQKD